MAQARRSDKHPHRLVVENKDAHAIIHLMAAHGVNWDDFGNDAPYIDLAGDWVKARDGFEAALRAPTYRRVGVVLDADASADSRWASLRNVLTRAGWSPPTSPLPGGWVEDRGGARVGAWLMPDNQRGGRLEEFLAELIPLGDRCWPHAQDSAAHALRLGAPFAEIDLLKAQLHTWLAWRDEPGLPYGTAIRGRRFDPQAQSALPFVGWFKAVFL